MRATLTQSQIKSNWAHTAEPKQNPRHRTPTLLAFSQLSLPPFTPCIGHRLTHH
jgi:hypothetical protein